MLAHTCVLVALDEVLSTLTVDKVRPGVLSVCVGKRVRERVCVRVCVCVRAARACRHRHKHMWGRGNHSAAQNNSSAHSASCLHAQQHSPGWAVLVATRMGGRPQHS